MESGCPIESGGRRRAGWWPRLPFAVLLVLGTGWAYFPALDRVFVADQLGYFAELHGETSLAAGFRLLDYGARRQYAKGDEASYRPLLFAGLAAGNTVLKRDFRAWNAANLLVHLGVAYGLFEVLWRLRRSVLAGGFALWFALLASNFELVTWNHLGGYMLGYGLLLAALGAAWRMANGGGRRWFWIYGIAIFGVMLEHEIGVVAALGGAAFGVWRGWRDPAARSRRWWLALGAPLLIYAALYVCHATQCERLFWVNSEGASGSFRSRLALVPVLIGRWFRHILLPHPDQMAISALRRSVWTTAPGGWLPGAVAAGVLLCLGRGLTWRQVRAAGILALGPPLLIVAYAGMNLTGRPAYALTVPYYAYFPALLAMAWMYALLDLSRVGRPARQAALAGLLLLAALNARELRRTAARMQDLNRPLARHLAWVENRVRPRISSPGYSFAIRGVPAELDLVGPLVFGYPDRKNSAQVPLLSFLYGKYYNSVSPAERIDYPGARALSGDP